MPDWLQDYGQLIGVLVGGAIAGAVAIVVGTMNNKASDSRLARQLTADQQREAARIRRERLEELYVQSGAWMMNLQSNAFLGLRLIGGLLTYTQYLDQQISLGKSSVVFHDPRMKMLLGVYGSPEVKLAHQDVLHARSRYHDAFWKHEILFKKGASPKCSREDYDAIDELVAAMSRAGDRLLEQIVLQTGK